MITLYTAYRSWGQSYLKREVWDHNESQAVLDDERYHHLMASGGAWHQHVEMHRAERDGDHERLAELIALRRS